MEEFVVVTRLFVETITGLTWERSEVNHDGSADDDNDNVDDDNDNNNINNEYKPP